ncbi:hypothetical protein BX600DRAFT_528562 [Xylariales sp. PMI_506]|nr:hypothetical protein BX600DRAFT_528562 [Xylariales sp. PMI_506]
MILVFVITAAPTAWTAIAALHVQLYTLGMLLFATIFVLVHAMFESPYHLAKVHRHAMDDIRIPLLSPLSSGMVYILPSRNFGFDAAFCQNIEDEQRILAANRQFFDPADVIRENWTLEKCRASAYKIITAQIEKIEYHPHMINDLGYWLYQRNSGDSRSTPPTQHSRASWKPNWLKSLKDTITGSYSLPHEASSRCKTRDGFTIIGRDVALSLLLWECLVFEWRWQLTEDIKKIADNVWLLRTPKHTGVGLTDTFAASGNIPLPTALNKNRTKGSAPKLEGFLEAVSEVYRLIGQPQSTDNGSMGQRTSGNEGDLEMATSRQDEAGKLTVKNLIRRLEEARIQGAPILKCNSIIKTLNPLVSVEDYAGELWEACWAEFPSTFGALYLWTTVWYIDNGNVGFHTTPLIPQVNPEDWICDGSNYMTAWRIRWRHRWHAAVWCQLLVLLPTMINGFLSMVGIP